jgi:hypothetical protein
MATIHPAAESGASAELAPEAFVRRHARWNFNVNLIDIAFITLGISLVSRETVMPVLVSSLTDSKILLGLIPAIYGMGIYLPQLFMANFTERLRYKKPFVAYFGGVGERLPYLLAGIAVWLWAETQPILALAALLLCLGVTAFAAGASMPAWFDLIAKVIPVQRRGPGWGTAWAPPWVWSERCW